MIMLMILILMDLL